MECGSTRNNAQATCCDGFQCAQSGTTCTVSTVTTQPPATTTSTTTTAIVTNPSSSRLIISGVIDGPGSGGLPKAIELYALDDISDLSTYGIGSANNGGGTDGQEFTLSGSVTAGSFITIASEAVEYTNYFGEAPTFTSGSANINGDDAIELFYNGGVVDTYGDASVAGTGQAWEYADGWAYRNSESSPGTFQIGEWNLSGPNAIVGCTSNDLCGNKFPYKSFGSTAVTTQAATTTAQATTTSTNSVICECLPTSTTSTAAATTQATSTAAVTTIAATTTLAACGVRNDPCPNGDTECCSGFVCTSKNGNTKCVPQ